MLLAGRFLVSAPWPEGNDGQYYWQHCFWINNSDFASNAAMNLAVVQDMGLLYTDQVRFWSCRWYIPNTETVFFQNDYPSFQFGSQPAQENFNLLIAARWRMRGSDGSYTYHLHRQPVGADYIEGGEWSAVGDFQQRARVNTYVAQGIYRTQTGSLISSGVLASRPIKWQLRHGSRRRSRRFWLP